VRIEDSLIRSWRGSGEGAERERRGLKTARLVEIVRRGLKLRCIAQFKHIFRPEDGLPASGVKSAAYNFVSSFI
jgi:hypothetical protein